MKTLSALLHFVNPRKELDQQRAADGELPEQDHHLDALLLSFGMAVQDAMVIIDATGKVSFWNPAAERLFGYSVAEALGQDIHYLTASDPSNADLARRFQEAITSGNLISGQVRQFTMRRKNQSLFLAELSVSEFKLGANHYLVGIVRDVTERQRAQESQRLNGLRLAALLELARMTEEPEINLTDYALEKAVELTGSALGYLAFVNDDEAMMTMYSWSKTAMAECAVADKPLDYPLETTGLWGEALRQRKPIVTNDYQAPNPWKKGCPEGHVALMRHMNIPLFDGERIVLVAGVGNKPEPYDDTDVNQLTLLMEGMWKILKRQRAEQAIRASERRLQTIASTLPGVMYQFYARPDGSMGLYYVSGRVEDILGLDGQSDDFFQRFTNCVAAEERDAFLASINEAVQAVRPWDYEGRFIKPDGSEMFFRGTSHPETRAGELVFTGLLLDITERKRAERILRVQYELSLVSSMSVSLETTLQACLEAAIRVSGLDSGGIYLVDEASGALHLRLHQGLSEAFVTSVSDYPADAPNTRLLMAGKPVYSRHRQLGLPMEIPARQDEALQALAIVPVLFEARVIAGVNVASHTLDEVPPYAQKALETISAQIGVAIAHARAQERALSRTAELQALFEFSTRLRTAQDESEMLALALAEIHRLVAADTGEIILLDSDGAHFTVALADGVLAPNAGRQVTLAEGASGQALRTHLPYTTLDYASDPHRVADLYAVEQVGPAVSIALRSEIGIQGFMFVARLRGPQVRPFTPDEVHLLAGMGEMVGNALRRARLFDQAMNRLQRIQALREIDVTIATSLDLQLSLDILLSEATRQLKVDAAAVLLLNTHTLALEYAAGRGFHTARIRYARPRLGYGCAGRAVLERRMQFVPDLEQASDFQRVQMAREEGFKTYIGMPIIAKGEARGVLELFHRVPLALAEEWVEYLGALASQAAIAIDNTRLFQELDRANLELRLAYDATIEGWSQALELREQEVAGHSERVVELTMRLAEKMGFAGEELVHIRRGSLLHDIGKMGIPDHILLKPGPLTAEEWEIMHQHPVHARRLLAGISYLAPALEIPYYHHERWDGSGYPAGLKGEAIPKAARIFAVVDVWDALTSDRPYRHAWSEDNARRYLQEQAGKQFDPQVIETFLKLVV